MSQKFTLSRAKDPYERFFAEIDISQWLANETISNVDFTAQDEDGVNMSTTFLDAAKCTFSAGILKPYIQNGEDGKRYHIVMKVSTLQDPSRDVFTLTVNVKNII
jgi:hypothetical protein